MKYKVSKEELDALFREVYSSSLIDEHASQEKLTPIKEHIFLAYRYKNTIKKYIVSTLPLKIKLKSFNCYEGREISSDNLFISGYDVEKKFRVYITVDSSFEEIITKKFSTGLNSILDRSFNPQNFVENLSEHLLSEIKRDFPYSYKKINSPVLQFYEDDFVKLEYVFFLEEGEGEISVWMEKSFIETETVSPIVLSPPTTAGRKKLKKLLAMLDVQYTVQSEAVNIPVSKLKLGSEIEIDLKLRKIIG